MADDRRVEAAPNYWEEWAARTPLATRLIVYTLTALYLLSFVLPTSAAFRSCPLFIVQSFELYRLLLSAFFQRSLLSLLFAFFSFATTAAAMERALGTLGTLAHVCLFAWCATTLAVMLAFLLALNPLWPMPMMMLSCSQGFWPVIMATTVLSCHRNPTQPRRLWLLPVQIPAVYYPWALLAMFTLLRGHWTLDLLTGVLTGYLYLSGMLAWAVPSDDRLQAWEAGAAAWLAAKPGFISVNDAAGYEMLDFSARQAPSGGGGSGGGSAAAGRSAGGGSSGRRGPRGNIAGFFSMGSSDERGSGRAGGGSAGGSDGRPASGGDGSFAWPSGGGRSLGGGAGADDVDSIPKSTFGGSGMRLGGGSGAAHARMDSSMLLSDGDTVGGSDAAPPEFSHEAQLQALLDMGFGEGESINALTLTHGDIVGAVELLRRG